MKDKKKMAKIVFYVVSIIIVVVCIIIQIIIKNKTKKLEEESQKYESLKIETKSGNEIETEYFHVEDEKFYFKVPKSFKQLDYETIHKKYNGNVPKVVFSNDETTINIAISITEDQMKDSQIYAYKQYMENLLKTNSTIVDTNYYKVDNHNVGQIKLISKATDTNIYNNMIFFSYKDKLAIVTFNCTENLQEEWEDVGNFIIDSLFFEE